MGCRKNREGRGGKPVGSGGGRGLAVRLRAGIYSHRRHRRGHTRLNAVCALEKHTHDSVQLAASSFASSSQQASSRGHRAPLGEHRRPCRPAQRGSGDQRAPVRREQTLRRRRTRAPSGRAARPDRPSGSMRLTAYLMLPSPRPSRAPGAQPGCGPDRWASPFFAPAGAVPSRPSLALASAAGVHHGCWALRSATDVTASAGAPAARANPSVTRDSGCPSPRANHCPRQCPGHVMPPAALHPRGGLAVRVRVNPRSSTPLPRTTASQAARPELYHRVRDMLVADGSVPTAHPRTAGRVRASRPHWGKQATGQMRFVRQDTLVAGNWTRLVQSSRPAS